ncbi:hypothetical protein F5Y16DRAFT_362864 [Xylariaceae sp. FL0255]|nr:hypothetical protein F5Y16DRAFT_362864 [Xylariaceae sp. FL0255]
MPPSSSKSNNLKVPPRPKTPTDYVPTSIHVTHDADNSFQELMNPAQRFGPVLVHSVPADRFKSLAPPSPLKSDNGGSTASKKSILKKAMSSISLGIGKGKTALATGKQALTRSASGSDRKGKWKAKLEKEPSDESLFSMHRLPKLKIPKTETAVYAALNSACSTNTLDSPIFFKIVEMSPTSDELSKWMDDADQLADVTNEFRNMYSARRRVRKSSFGQQVQEYSKARHGWDDTVGVSHNENEADIAQLKKIHRALQEQKDHATRLIQDHGATSYPGFKEVSRPGVTKPLYWQGKSLHKHATISKNIHE